jgi:molybdate transport system substrate-binding protein
VLDRPRRDEPAARRDDAPSRVAQEPAAFSAAAAAAAAIRYMCATSFALQSSCIDRRTMLLYMVPARKARTGTITNEVSYVKRLLIATLVFVGFATTTRAEEPREITVFAAASLREAFEDLAKTFESKSSGVKVRVNLAGSQELRIQIENGARADVFASADQKHMAALVKANLVATPRVFARNMPVVIVPKGNPAKVGSFEELTKAKKLVIGVPEVPIGTYTMEILEKAGADFKKKVLANVASRELNVRQVLAKVSLGEADAGIVYRTDAMAGKDKVEIIEIPAKVNVIAEYPIAVLSKAPQPAAARAFVDLLLSAEGQKRLAAAGFVAP